MQTFEAFRIHLGEGGSTRAGLEQLRLDDLSPGDVVIRAAWSSINYKDALAATGQGKILRRSPLVGGVDVAGTVESSADPRFAPGDAVVVVGCGLSETHDGGFSERVRLPGDFLNPLPEGLELREAMAIGTAGFTAAYALHRMEHNGQQPDMGPIAVTGATGGVGSVAIDIFSQRGYEVHALTHKRDADDYLLALGAREIRHVDDTSFGTRPLEPARWGGAVDNLGGSALSWLTRSVTAFGNVASIGLAASAELSTTVMPFILRGVSLLGINSRDVPRDTRLAVWQRLAGELKPAELGRIITREVRLQELPGCFEAYMNGSFTGRTLVRIA